MSEAQHDLAHDFPDHKAQIHALKMSNAHFARLAGEYHEVQKRVHRAEIGVEPVSDNVLEDMKKKRLRLKDELYGMLRTP